MIPENGDHSTAFDCGLPGEVNESLKPSVRVWPLCSLHRQWAAALIMQVGKGGLHPLPHPSIGNTDQPSPEITHVWETAYPQ